jgi:hypothetical protein
MRIVHARRGPGPDGSQWFLVTVKADDVLATRERIIDAFSADKRWKVETFGPDRSAPVANQSPPEWWRPSREDTVRSLLISGGGAGYWVIMSNDGRVYVWRWMN